MRFINCPYPFVSSEVETPVEIAPGPRGISTSLDANGIKCPTSIGRSPLRFQPRPESPRPDASPRRRSKDSKSHRRGCGRGTRHFRSEEHTSELQTLMRISYAVICLKQKNENI